MKAYRVRSSSMYGQRGTHRLTRSLVASAIGLCLAFLLAVPAAAQTVNYGAWDNQATGAHDWLFYRSGHYWDDNFASVNSQYGSYEYCAALVYTGGGHVPGSPNCGPPKGLFYRVIYCNTGAGASLLYPALGNRDDNAHNIYGTAHIIAGCY